MRGPRHAPAALYPGKDPVTIVQAARWAPGQVWTGAKNLAPTGIRSPDRPARSQSLYRLRYAAHGNGHAEGKFRPVTSTNSRGIFLQIQELSQMKLGIQNVHRQQHVGNTSVSRHAIEKCKKILQLCFVKLN